MYVCKISNIQSNKNLDILSKLSIEYLNLVVPQAKFLYQLGIKTFNAIGSCLT